MTLYTIPGEHAQHAPSVPMAVIVDYLVRISALVARRDDAKAQAEIGELLKMITSAPKPALSVPTSLLVAIADLATQMEIVSRVGFIDTPNDKDSCAAFCVAEGTWLELMSCVELLADEVVAPAAPEGKPCP